MKRYKRISVIALLPVAVATLLTGCRGDDSIHISAVFHDVGDLVSRASVQVSDVKVGTVDSIGLSGYDAKVEMTIDRSAHIPANATAIIRSTSLLGEKFVELKAPDASSVSDVLKDGASIPADRTGRIPGLDDVLVKLGRILEGGDLADLGTFIHSAAGIVDGKQQQLGDIFAELNRLSTTINARTPELVQVIDNLDPSFGHLAAASSTIGQAIDDSARAMRILAQQSTDLDRLLVSLDRFASVTASLAKDTTTADDVALKDLRVLLQQAVTATSDLDQSLSALARFTDLWPRAIPGDYIQLRVNVEGGNAGPAAVGAASRAGSPAAKRSGSRRPLDDLLWEGLR